jgi:hypothetical protein
MTAAILMEFLRVLDTLVGVQGGIIVHAGNYTAHSQDTVCYFNRM